MNFLVFCYFIGVTVTWFYLYLNDAYDENFVPSFYQSLCWPLIFVKRLAQTLLQLITTW